MSSIWRGGEIATERTWCSLFDSGWGLNDKGVMLLAEMPVRGRASHELMELT